MDVCIRRQEDPQDPTHLIRLNHLEDDDKEFVFEFWLHRGYT